jgi:hypothetical protein
MSTRTEWSSMALLEMWEMYTKEELQLQVQELSTIR